MFWQYVLIGLMITFWVAFALMETYMALNKDNHICCKVKKANKKKRGK